MEDERKMETKPEDARRLEERKKQDGKIRIRTLLWRQIREKDGNLVMVWRRKNPKEMELEPEQEQGRNSWLEEITLTVAERKALQDLEESKLDKTACNPAAPYPHSQPTPA
jgi:hypothetical protein